MSQTNHPVQFIGLVRYRPTRILSLAFVQAAARAELEIDLSALPPLISGGDRKARSKAIAEQRSSLSAKRRHERHRWDNPAYGSWAVTCPHCRHGMFLDEVDGDVLCDRCHRVFG